MFFWKHKSDYIPQPAPLMWPKKPSLNLIWDNTQYNDTGNWSQLYTSYRGKCQVVLVMPR